MRIAGIAGLACLLMLGAAQAQEQRARAHGGYNGVLAVLQNSSWRGTFTSGPGGVPTCYGSIDVHFFPMHSEPFAGGAQTVSYRHQAHFSPATPFVAFCGTIGAAMSNVDVSGCEKLALQKQTVENGRKVTVPVRTLIARNGGSSLVVSTPTCVNENGHPAIKRMEFSVQQIEFTDPQKRNALTMTLSLGAVVSHYDLQRVGR
jgi:hypothetical protein